MHRQRTAQNQEHLRVHLPLFYSMTSKTLDMRMRRMFCTRHRAKAFCIKHVHNCCFSPQKSLEQKQGCNTAIGNIWCLLTTSLQCPACCRKFRRPPQAGLKVFVYDLPSKYNTKLLEKDSRCLNHMLAAGHQLVTYICNRILFRKRFHIATGTVSSVMLSMKD
jgi:hypothetical protein